MLEGGGKTPILTPLELEQLGYKLVAYPLSLIGVSIQAMQVRFSLSLSMCIKFFVICHGYILLNLVVMLYKYNPVFNCFYCSLAAFRG